MRVEVEPRSAVVAPGQPTVLTVRVVNTGTVISGHSIRVLGVDPRWIRIDQPQLSLFPDAAGVAVLTVTLPRGIPAGVRRIGVEVRELTPPNDQKLVEVDLTVPAQLGLKVDLDPLSTTGGKTTQVGVIIDNTGNSEIEVDLSGADDEAHIRFAFNPPRAVLAPGERTLASAELRAKRPKLGSPKVRPFRVLVGPGQPPVSAFGTWVQKPLLSRGAIALIGLVAVVSVFALVLTFSLSRVVGKSTADRDLALQVAQASQAGGAGGAGGSGGSVAGTVTLLTSGTGVGGVTVEIFNAANTEAPLASVATSDTGAYHFQGLGVGTYKVRYSGAGFTQLWYPTSLTPENGTPVALTAGQAVSGIDARLGGVPASLTGKVVGADPTGATVSLELPTPSASASTNVASATTTTTVPAGSGPITITPPPAAAIVSTQTLDAAGTFTLTQIPSPSVYQLVVAKQGFATAIQTVDLGSGEQRSGLVISLRQGDGSIAGLVSGPQGPLPNATISASDGHNTVSTVTVSQGPIGTFTLDNLPTPDNFTITVSAPGAATQTLTVALAAAQHLTGVSVALVSGVGSISGKALLAAVPPSTTSLPAGGVTVTVTNGQVAVQTVTLSIGPTGAPGTYQVLGLPVPGTYTVSFSRPDLASQTQAVTLDALNGSTINATGVNVTLNSATAQLAGTVSQGATTSLVCDSDDGACNSCKTLVNTASGPIGQVAVTLTSGSTAYQVTSSSGASTLGQYAFNSVAPGTYTLTFSQPGGVPASTILTLVAGQKKPMDQTLQPSASICGQVLNRSVQPNVPLQGVQVQLFLTSQFGNGPPVQTTTSDGNGIFHFATVAAPQSYLVQFAFPQGSSPQPPTVPATVTLGQQKVICDPNVPSDPGAPAPCAVQIP